MLDDVEEGDASRPTLCDIKPGARPGVIHDVRFASEPDVHPVTAVIEEGDKDERPFEHADQGKRIEELHLLGVSEGALERLEVREDVFEKEGADGNDSGERVELAPQERVPLAGAKRLHAAGDLVLTWEGRRGGLLGSSHCEVGSF